MPLTGSMTAAVLPETSPLRSSASSVTPIAAVLHFSPPKVCASHDRTVLCHTIFMAMYRPFEDLDHAEDPELGHGICPKPVQNSQF